MMKGDTRDITAKMVVLRLRETTRWVRRSISCILEEILMRVRLFLRKIMQNLKENTYFYTRII